jgi:hypothetical protein
MGILYALVRIHGDSGESTLLSINTVVAFVFILQHGGSDPRDRSDRDVEMTREET